MAGAIHLDPGQLRHRLQLQENQIMPDGQGGFVDNWQSVGDVWASFGKPRTTLGVRMDGEDGQLTQAIIVRAGQGVEQGMRFLTGSEIWAIRAVHDPDGTGRYVQCQCRLEAAP